MDTIAYSVAGLSIAFLAVAVSQEPRRQLLLQLLLPPAASPAPTAASEKSAQAPRHEEAAQQQQGLLQQLASNSSSRTSNTLAPQSAVESSSDDDDESDAGGNLVGSNSEHYAVESENLLSLLYSIAEDQSRKEGFVHRSITCNNCGTSPIRGYRYKCANCVDFDLCESCESLDLHNKTHVWLKIKIPIPPLANPRSALLMLFYPGDEFTEGELNSADVDYTELQAITHFDQVELEAFYEQFKSLATRARSEKDDSFEIGITRDTFEQCLGPLGMERNLIAERIFCFFDQDRTGVISFSELACGMSILCKGTLDERVKHAFSGYDIDGDGRISKQELFQMFKAYFHLSMELVRDVVKTMEEGMMESFDDEASKPISAAFSAPVPISSYNPDSSSGDEDGEGGRGRKAKKSKGYKKNKHVARADQDSATEAAIPSSSEKQKSPRSANTSPTRNGVTFAPAATTGVSVVTMSSSVFSPTSARSITAPAFSPSVRTPRGMYPRRGSAAASESNRSPSPVSYEDITTSSLRSARPRSAVGNGANSDALPYHHPYATSARERFNSLISETGSTPLDGMIGGRMPIMESMSQNAIDQMVERTFASAGVSDSDGGLSFEDFKRVVEGDSNMLAWFEALGSVF